MLTDEVKKKLEKILSLLKTSGDGESVVYKGFELDEIQCPIANELTALYTEMVEGELRTYTKKITNAFRNGKMGTKYSPEDDLSEKVLQVSAPQIVEGVFREHLTQRKETLPVENKK